MLSRLVNEALLEFDLTTRSPTMVKTGDEGACVTTYRDGEWLPCLPGSSMKGALRSHFERVVRGLRLKDNVVCDPLGFENCGRKLGKAKNGEVKNGEEAYRGSCPACRMFGSTAMASRVIFSDARLAPDQDAVYEHRDGIAINRLTGGVDRHLLFSFDPMAAGTRLVFEATLRNFEAWQLGALFLLAEHLDKGHIRLGFGKSRGFGAVAGRVKRATISHFGAGGREATGEIWGLGRFLGDGRYGTEAQDTLMATPTRTEEPLQGLTRTLIYEDQALKELAATAAGELVRRIEAWLR
jgi:CRISPR-associated protein Csm3